MRGRFFWRIGCGLIFLVVLVAGGTTLIFWLLAALSGLVNLPEGWLALVPAAVLLIVLAVGGLVITARLLRRTAAPVGDLIDAAGRLSDGDYSARVSEGGPREVRSLVHAFNAMAEGLQKSDEQRRRLLADVTHELRTPLTVIQGNLEGMLDGIYPTSREHIESVLEETRTLSRVIDDLRTLSLAESGALQLELESTVVGDLLAEAAVSFSGQASTREIGLDVEAPASLPLVDVDPTRIREVLANLLVNALRYTPAGGQILLRADRLENPPEQVQVAVSDTGSGIPPEDLLHIFDRFYKSSDSRGSGLGLAISKSLVTAHGGDISAASEVGKGTTITFTLPVSRKM